MTGPENKGSKVPEIFEIFTKEEVDPTPYPPTNTMTPSELLWAQENDPNGFYRHLLREEYGDDPIEIQMPDGSTFMFDPNGISPGISKELEDALIEDLKIVLKDVFDEYKKSDDNDESS